MDWLWAKIAAWRTGLRDKGKKRRVSITYDRDGYTEIFSGCVNCKTRLRIGILKKNNRTVQWCWRCETYSPVEYDSKIPLDDRI